MTWTPPTFEAKKTSDWNKPSDGTVVIRVVKRLCSTGQWAVHYEAFSDDPNPNSQRLRDGFYADSEAAANAEFDRRVKRYGITAVFTD